jgi:hypothetical protein
VFVEVVVAAVTAGIALLALVVSIIVAQRQTAIQERLAAVEEARRAEEVEARTRARVTASIMRVETPPLIRTVASSPAPISWPVLLVLRNEGPALARDVQVQVEEAPHVPTVNGLEVLPVDLQPGQPMTFHMPVAMGDAATIRVTVRWTDGAGGHEEPFTLQIH